LNELQAESVIDVMSSVQTLSVQGVFMEALSVFQHFFANPVEQTFLSPK